MLRQTIKDADVWRDEGWNIKGREKGWGGIDCFGESGQVTEGEASESTPPPPHTPSLEWNK